MTTVHECSLWIARQKTFTFVFTLPKKNVFFTQMIWQWGFMVLIFIYLHFQLHIFLPMICMVLYSRFAKFNITPSSQHFFLINKDLRPLNLSFFVLFLKDSASVLAHKRSGSDVDLLEANYRDIQVPNAVKQIRSEMWGCICPHQDGERQDVEGRGWETDSAVCGLMFEKTKTCYSTHSRSLSLNYNLRLFFCLCLCQWETCCVRNTSSASACFISGLDWSINDTAAFAFAHCIVKLHFN